VKQPEAFWQMTYAADRRKHRHRCRHCNRIVQPGEEVFMARLSNGKTKVLHVEQCADQIAVNNVTELELLECHGMKYVAGLGFPAAQKWLDESQLTKTRPMVEDAA